MQTLNRIILLLPIAVLLSGQLLAQNNRAGESPTAKVERLALSSRSGNSQDTTELARQMFRNVAIPTDLADSLGFTDRIVKAEVDYRKGEHSRVNEATVVKAINNMVATIGAPSWTNTNLAEVRKVRMHLLVSYPRFMASNEPADSKGHYKAISTTMTPIEASFVATTLLFQKRFNPDYQFSDIEKSANASLDTASLKAAQAQRTAELQNLLQGKTRSLSVRDLLSASDHFFSDLGIEPVPTLGAVAFNGRYALAGGRK